MAIAKMSVAELEKFLQVEFPQAFGGGDIVVTLDADLFGMPGGLAYARQVIDRRRQRTSSSNRRPTRSVSRSSPVIVISLPRTRIDTGNAASMRRSSSSRWPAISSSALRVFAACGLHQNWKS